MSSSPLYSSSPQRAGISLTNSSGLNSGLDRGTEEEGLTVSVSDERDTGTGAGVASGGCGVLEGSLSGEGSPGRRNRVTTPPSRKPTTGIGISICPTTAPTKRRKQLIYLAPTLVYKIYYGHP